MPYGVYKVSNQYCVHKKEPDGSRGKKIACHATRTKAFAQIRAIEANEKKELEMANAALKVTVDVTDELKETVEKIDWFDRMKNVVKDTIESTFKPKEKQTSGFMIWKEGDQLRWLARYSTNFRDDDNPPEIISAESHRRFVDMVDKKEAPMPELWLWHTPEWRLGEADWLAYDDSGFALASGTIDRGKEIVAEQIAKQKLVGVSHGMPVESVKRDQDDPTVIVEHISAEISPLPHDRAANKMAAWVLLGDTMKEGNNMPIPDEKKQTLVDQWNMDRSLLDQLEDLNAHDAEKATEEGIESKEKSEEEVAEQEEQVEEKEEVAAEDTEEVVEEEVTETEPETDEPDTMPVEEPPSRQEIADAIATVLKPYVELAQELEGRIKSLEKSDEEKVAKAATLTPSASVSALLAQQFSAIGDEVAKIDGRKSLAKSKPKEAEEYVDGGTRIPFIDKMLYGEEDSE